MRVQYIPQADNACVVEPRVAVDCQCGDGGNGAEVSQRVAESKGGTEEDVLVCATLLCSGWHVLNVFLCDFCNLDQPGMY